MRVRTRITFTGRVNVMMNARFRVKGKVSVGVSTRVGVVV